MNEQYDIIIIGGGPAGLTASIYALRAGRSVLVVESDFVGGQMQLTYDVQNYPGFRQISGQDLSEKMYNHALSLGAHFEYSALLEILPEKDCVKAVCKKGTFSAKKLIICTGSKSRTLEVSGEKQFAGKGVSYCATCDGNFFKGRTVAVVGGGNSAFEDLVYLSNICDQVIHIHRSEHFKADHVLVEQVKGLISQGKIKQYLNAVVTAVNGDDTVRSVTVRQGKDTFDLPTDALFVAAGRKPYSDVLKGLALDDYGYIITDDYMRTNIPNVYAAGDVRSKAVRQIVTACADGAVAGIFASADM